MSVSWVKYRKGDTETEGWLRAGTLLPQELLGGDFWTRGARIACAGLGRTLDEVHTYTGALVAGPFGASTSNGGLAVLLSQMSDQLLAHHLGDAFETVGLGIRGGYSPAFTVGVRKAMPADVSRKIVRDFDIAREWVIGTGALLADPVARRTLGQCYGDMLRKQLTANKFGDGVFRLDQAAHMNGHARKALATLFAFAVDELPGATRLLNQAGLDSNGIIQMAQRPGPWPTEFGPRAVRIENAVNREEW